MLNSLHPFVEVLHTPGVEEVPFIYPDPERKTPAQGIRISLEGPTIVLLSVNSKDRVPWIAQDAVHRPLKAIWRSADAWLVGYYLLMPDHIHLFCAPRDLSFTIEKWMSYWKSLFSRAHVHQPWAWQRAGFHHRLRNQREFQDKWTYVRENPVRKGLVATPDDWPYQGTIHELRW